MKCRPASPSAASGPPVSSFRSTSPPLHDAHRRGTDRTLPQSTDITREISTAAAELLERALPARFAIRLLGVGVSGFENREQVQQSLFADEDRQKQGRLDTVADEIRAKFGATGLGRGSGMLHEAKHRPEPRPNDER